MKKLSLPKLDQVYLERTERNYKLSTREKIFATYITNKDLLSEVCEYLLKSIGERPSIER